MTTPSPAQRRRPRLLIFVVLAWVATAALGVGGTFAPLFVETETHSSPASSSTESSSSSDEEEGSSFELTAWGSKSVTRGEERESPIMATWYGVPLVIAAAVVFAGGLIGVGALATRSDPGLRWATGVAGGGSLILLGAAGTVAMSVKSLSDTITEMTASAGREDLGPSLEAGVGNGMWMLLLGASLGVLATFASMILRSRTGPGLVAPEPEAEPEEAAPAPEDGPATPAFGVPVIRPIGYD